MNLKGKTAIVIRVLESHRVHPLRCLATARVGEPLVRPNLELLVRRRLVLVFVDLNLDRTQPALSELAVVTNGLAYELPVGSGYDVVHRAGIADAAFGLRQAPARGVPGSCTTRATHRREPGQESPLDRSPEGGQKAAFVLHR